MKYRYSVTTYQDYGASSLDAISVCFFRNTPKFNHTKHVQQLERGLSMGNMDVLLFVQNTNDLPECVEGNPRVRIFVVDQHFTGYRKHFYRYAACLPQFNNYRWVWFTGTDNIVPSVRSAILLNVVNAFTNPPRFIASNSPSTLCCPNVWVNHKGRSTLLNHLHRYTFPHDDWHCDDKFFDQFVLQTSVPFCLVNSAHGHKHPKFDYLVKLLSTHRSNSMVVNL